MKKRVLSVFLTLCMMLTLLPASVLAAEETNDGTPDQDVLDTMPEADEEGNITLEKDVVLTETWKIEVDDTITLNLNKHTISNSAACHIISNYGNLSIVGPGKVETTTDEIALVNYTGGTVSISENVELNRSSGSGYVIKNMGTEMIIDEAIVTDTDKNSSLIVNGWYGNAGTDCGETEPTNGRVAKLIINGGVFTGGKNVVKNDDCGDLLINNGTFSNADEAVILNWNVAKIVNGDFDMKAEGIGLLANAYQNATTDKGELTIEGGTYTVEEGTLFGKANNVIGGKLTISDGTFEGLIGNDRPYAVEISGGDFTSEFASNIEGGHNDIKISGGSFTSDPSRFVVTGKTAQFGDDKWTIEDETTDPETYAVGISVVDGTTALLNGTMTAADLMDGVELSAPTEDKTFTLTGTVNYVDNWEAFNETVEAEQSGHYVALKFVKPENAPEAFEVVLTGANGAKKFDQDDFFVETDDDASYETVIVRLDALRTATDTSTEAKNKFTAAFTWNEETTDTYTFDISELIFEVPEVTITPPTVADGTASAEVKEEDIKDALDAIIANAGVGDEGGEAAAPVVTIDASATASGESVTTAEVKLPSAVVSAVQDAAEKVENLTVELKTDVGTVTIDQNVVAKLAEQTGKDVTLNVEKTEADETLPAAAEGSEVYEVNFTAKGSGDAEGTEIAFVEADSVTITLELTFSGTDTDGKTIGWTSGDESGKVPKTDGMFTLESGMTKAKFTVNHLTSFYLTEEDAGGSEVGEITFTKTTDTAAGNKIVLTSTAENHWLTIQLTNSSANVIWVVNTGATKTVAFSVPSGYKVAAWETATEPNFTAGTGCAVVAELAQTTI